MNKNQKIALVIGVAAFVFLVVRPPYFAMDQESNGRLHASIGYHWIWNPPTAEDAYRYLVGDDPASVDPARLASFEVRLNSVRLGLNVVILAVVVTVGTVLLRRRTKVAPTVKA